MMARIGVFVCHCGANIGSVVDVEEVRKFAEGLEDVVAAKDYKYMCSDPGGKLIQDTIIEQDLDRVVVASCSPRMHEPTFRKVVSDVGMNPYCCEMANIREHCSWVHMEDKERATEKAMEIVASMVAKVRLLEPLEKREADVVREAMVVGGGIAGIQASLDLADQGFKVYLVEKTPSIGGRMAQLDKTFPTLDCSSCILTPKMMDVGKHPNIELMTYSEVEEVSGSIGNFKVKVRKKPTFVDWDACTGCGECAKACMLKDKVPDEFNQGLGNRGAIYCPFPQAVPLRYTIDAEKCLFIKFGKCGEKPACIEACEADAIRHDMDKEGELVELNVGSIIVATGYDMLDGDALYELGYDKSPNVITNLEFERLVSSYGPTEGHIVKPSDKGEIKSVSYVLCVGSRDEGERPWCCRVGCMSALKHAYLIREHLGSDVEINICYNDIRAFGKGYEEFYRRVRGMNVNFIRGRPSEIRVLDDDQLEFDVFDTSTKKELQVTSDLVVLVPALVPRADAEGLAKILKISQGADGFLLEAHPKLRPADTATKGIFLAGCCQGPKDIPDSVGQASGAAAKAAIPLASGKVEIDPQISVVNVDICSGCGICESMCEYGAIEILDNPNIPGKKTAQVNDSLCEGCGSCVSACPSGAIEQRGYKNDQLNAMIEKTLILEEKAEPQ